MFGFVFVLGKKSCSYDIYLKNLLIHFFGMVVWPEFMLFICVCMHWFVFEIIFLHAYLYTFIYFGYRKTRVPLHYCNVNGCNTTNEPLRHCMTDKGDDTFLIVVGITINHWENLFLIKLWFFYCYYDQYRFFSNLFFTDSINH